MNEKLNSVARGFFGSRRDWLRTTLGAAAGISASGWFDALAAQAATDNRRKRSCILLWMSGGPSQTDTFDLKPGHANGGPFKAIKTSAPGMEICEHMPRLARLGDHLSIVRSMSTKEGDHSRATYLLRTGYVPGGPVAYPSLGSLVGKTIGDEAAELPNCVSIAPMTFLSPAAFGPGFLGPRHAPLVVGNGQFVVQQGNNYEQQLKVPNLTLAKDVERAQADARLGLLADMERTFADTHPGHAPQSHVAAYRQADRLMRSSATAAFDLEGEAAPLRDAYGRNAFGQGCLLARRLIERGVPFVEVSFNGLPELNTFGWDTHQNNFDLLKKMLPVLDSGWATLIEDLKMRGLLDSTLVVWMGEFGRTPKINNNQGRDHFPTAWSTVLAGGGIAGGQVVGRTSEDGMQVADRPVSVPDLLGTMVLALGLDPMDQNMSNVGRPIRLVDPSAKPLRECLV
ncbi:MAG TPA: DUF1501 domain-containing protein [Pirellulales bacterium]|nr:DUF1501 domain-containing protein [Pirellulales bacterium]